MLEVLPRAAVLTLALSAAAGPAHAQYYWGGYARPYEMPAYGPPVYAPRPANVMLPPWEVRNIIRRMGYGQVGRPHLSGRVYAVQATDGQGPVTLSVDAFSGRVIAARPLSADRSTIAIPGSVPPGTPAPRAASRSAPVPLPPERPAEAEFSRATPEAAAPAPVRQEAKADTGTPVPAAPSAPEPAASVSRAPSAPFGPGASGTPAPGAAPQVSMPQSGALPAAPVVQVAPVQVAPVQVAPVQAAPTQAAPGVAPAKSPADASKVSAGAGAGTGTPGGSSAGSASVLSRAGTAGAH